MWKISLPVINDTFSHIHMHSLDIVIGQCTLCSVFKKWTPINYSWPYIKCVSFMIIDQICDFWVFLRLELLWRTNGSTYTTFGKVSHKSHHALLQEKNTLFVNKR